MDHIANDIGADPSDPWLVVGEVTGPFGIRGQVKIRPLIDDPKSLLKLPGVLLRYPDGREERSRVTEARRQMDSAILTLDTVPDRNASELMRGVFVLIRRSELPPLEPDAYYETQLVGLQVVTESGRDMGVIEQVHFYPANDVYETPVALIPAVSDMIVQVDLEGGRLVVRDVPGLRKDE